MKTIASGNNKICKGFTLVELLVVISIIALLLSILMPSLQKARQQAKALVCSNNIKQLAMGWRFYEADNDGIFPIGLVWGIPNPRRYPELIDIINAGGDRQWWSYDFGIGSYMPAPALKDGYAPNGGPQDRHAAWKGWYCTKTTKFAIEQNRYTGYHFSTEIGYYKRVKVFKIKRTSMTPLLFCFWDSNPIDSLGKNYLGNYFSNPIYGETNYKSYRFYAGVSNVHGNGTNFGFADGHNERVRPLKNKEEYADKFNWNP